MPKGAAAFLLSEGPARYGRGGGGADGIVVEGTVVEDTADAAAGSLRIAPRRVRGGAKS